MNRPRDPLRAAVARAMRDETNGAGAKRVNLSDIVLSWAQQIGDLRDAAGRPIDFALLSDGWAKDRDAHGWTAQDSFRLALAEAMTTCQQSIRAARDAYRAAQVPPEGLPAAPSEADARGPLGLAEGDELPLGGGSAE